MLVQLDVAAPRVNGAARHDVTCWAGAVARQTPRRYKVGGIPGVQVMYMDAKLVLGRRERLLLRVDRPYSKPPGPHGGTVNTHVGRPTDVACIVCGRRAASRARVNVCRYGVAAYMKTVVVVHIVDVTEEAAILAPAHQAEVRLLACLRQTGDVGGRPRRDEDKSSTGREVAQAWNFVRVHGCGLSRL